MKIELASWESVGVRCPDITVDLRLGGRIPQVALIQMPNGTGKTTTLELLNATLSGTASNWSRQQVRKYRRSTDSRPKGHFKTTLLIDGKPLTIELVLNYDTGQVAYNTTNPGSGGIQPGWRVRPAIKRFLTQEFLSLFVFDGEFAGRLLDDNRAEADYVVDALCQIYMLHDLSEFAHEYWVRSTRSQSTKTESGLARHQRERDGLVARVSKVRNAYEHAKTERSRLQADVDELHSKIEGRIESVEASRERHELARRARHQAELEVEKGRSHLMMALRLPHAIHPKLSERLIELYENLDRLRLPENTSAQFFQELIDEDDCICGRPIDDAAAREIRERATGYLDSDDAGVINALKEDIEQYAVHEMDGTEETGHERVVRLCDELTSSLRDEKEAGQEVSVLTAQLIDSGDTEVASWQADAQSKQEKLEKLKALIDEIEEAGDSGESDHERVMSLRVLEKRLREKNSQIAEISKTVHLRRQTELIKRLLETAAQRARIQIKQELLDECNKRLSRILANDPLKIHRIERSIRLENQAGASAGQTLSIGYTFLMTVLSRGQNNLPLVVDSPAGPIDEGVRRNIGRLLPSLCTQFVGFTINTERAGFVDTLERQAKDIRFLTLFRKTPGTERMMQDLPEGRFTETINAVLVDDRNYFYDFDVRDEEEDADAIQAS